MTTTKTIRCPAGTCGLAVAPWSPDEVYAVAANWAEASSPVLTWGEDRWIESGRQVADYRHEPAAALAAELREACDSDEEAEALAADATSIDSDDEADEDYGTLTDYYTGEPIRPATADEQAASREAAPEGVILVADDGTILRADDAGADDATRCYVEE
jgi:hypothetical protein